MFQRCPKLMYYCQLGLSWWHHSICLVFRSGSVKIKFNRGVISNRFVNISTRLSSSKWNVHLCSAMTCREITLFMDQCTLLVWTTLCIFISITLYLLINLIFKLFILQRNFQFETLDINKMSLTKENNRMIIDLKMRMKHILNLKKAFDLVNQERFSLKYTHVLWYWFIQVDTTNF